MDDKTSHTPGPWVVYHGPMGMREGLNPMFKGIVATLVYDGPESWVVTLDRDAPAFDYEANARLIAAAPDLLDALAGVLVSENDTHRESDDRWSVFRRAAHAAIAKAGGRS